MREDYAEHDTKISRRHALQTIAQFPIQMYGLAFLVGSHHILPPPEEFLPLCAASLSACRELRKYEAEGMAIIRRALAAYLPALEKIARRSSPSQQTAAHLAAQGYLLVQMLADYHGKLDQMEAAANQARFYGQLAQDPNLEASALVRLAVKFDYEHNYLKALGIYQEALALPGFGHVSPLLQGRVYGGLAGMYGQCQQKTSALSSLAQAKEIYPTNPETDPSYAFAYCEKHTLDLGEGLVLEGTGQYAEAMNVYLRYGSLTPLPGVREINRASHLNKIASVATKQRNLDAASLYLDAAEETAWTIQSKQRLSEVHETFRGMQLIWPHEPKVKMLQEKIYARGN